MSKYAIVKWRTGPFQRKTDPATISTTDAANPKANATKGTPIAILKWEQYVKKINSFASAKWLLKPYMMWINRRDEKCETLTVSGNFVEIIGENASHWLLRSQFNDLDTDLLSPENNNWFDEPTLYFKAQSVGLFGAIYNVGNALDVFVPFIKARKYPYTWIRKSKVELFPSLPYTLDDGRVIYEYVLEGASVKGGLNTGELIYLRKATMPGEQNHPTSWKLATHGVKPPAVSAL